MAIAEFLSVGRTSEIPCGVVAGYLSYKVFEAPSILQTSKLY